MEKKAAARKECWAKGTKRLFSYSRDFCPGGFGAPYADPQLSLSTPHMPSVYGGSKSVRPTAGLVGLCHNCGKFGHLKYNCTKAKMPNKYPFMVEHEDSVNSDVQCSYSCRE